MGLTVVYVLLQACVCLCMCLCACMFVCVACLFVWHVCMCMQHAPETIVPMIVEQKGGGRWPRLFSGSRRNHIVCTMSEWPPQAARHSASDYACEPDTEACDKGISSSSPSLPAAHSAAAAEGSVYSFAEKYLHSPLALRAR